MKCAIMSKLDTTTLQKTENRMKTINLLLWDYFVNDKDTNESITTNKLYFLTWVIRLIKALLNSSYTFKYSKDNKPFKEERRNVLNK